MELEIDAEKSAQASTGRARHLWRLVVKIMLLILLELLIVDVLLRFVDPLGAWAYAKDMTIINNSYFEHPDRGRIFAPGRYQATHWSYTILPDHSRLITGVVEHDCIIALVGDSVTFGLGVEDHQTWASLIAPHIPARLINAGVPGYNAQDVNRSINTLPADGYVWLLIENDADPPTPWHPGGAPMPDGGLVFHLRFFQLRLNQDAGAEDMAMFLDNASAVASRENAIILAFEEKPLTDLVPSAIVIPMYESIVSPVDLHADPTGNEIIAASALEHIRTLAERVCST